MHSLRLYRNATFYTGDPTQPRVNSLLTRGSRVLAIGDIGELQAHAGSHVESVDLDGATVIPGLTDAHIHTAHLARELAALDLRGTTSLEDALERVRTYAASLPADAYIFGGRWDFNAWDVPVQPNRQQLDAVSGSRPAILPSIDGHTIWANSAALARAGITAATPDPVGGEIVRDDNGEPTGILRESACAPLEELMDGPAAGDLVAQLREAQKLLLSVGLTGVHDFDGEDCLDAYRQLHAAGELNLRVYKSIPMTALDQAIAEGRATGDGDTWLRTGPVKIFSDGALGSHSCHMSEAFPGEGENFGIEVVPYDELRTLIRRAAAAGIAVATHAIGDRANELVLDAYEDLVKNPLDHATLREPGGSGLRHRIEHTQHLQPRDVQRLQRLGVIASMQPTHCTSDIPLASRLLEGRDLASYAWLSLIQQGAAVAFGSDAPVEPPNPLYGIHAAVTRENRDTGPHGGWQPQERISVAQAIAGFTTGAAYASHEDLTKGRLRPGMLADFVALGRDPFRCDPAELAEISVEAVAVDGVIRHRREG